MAFKHGKAAALYLGGADLTSFLNSIDLAASADAADTTVFGSAWKTSVIGSMNAQIAFGGFYDPAMTSLFALMTAGYPPGILPLTWAPSGAAAVGDAVRLAVVDVVNYAESVPVGGAVAFSGSFACNGSLAFGQLLHPWTEDTNTTTGSSKDDGAATATGWTAQLHIGAIDGGSWVVKLEDSADNGTWADVTGGAFTAQTGVAWQRLQAGSATAALRRYVRYTATRTGGSVGNGITFLLAYARTL